MQFRLLVMEAIGPEDLSKIGGIATVSLLHSFIPTHWLPFSIVGRAQKWTLSRTLLVTAFGAVLHVISTSLLGITAVTMANTIAGHSHSHSHPMEKMAVAGLVLVPALSPCATTLPVFLAVGNSSSMMVLAIIVLLFRRHTCYNGRDKGSRSSEGELTPKPVLSSDCRLQLACMKLESLVIAGQPYGGEFVPGPLYTPPVTLWELAMPEVVTLTAKRGMSKAGQVTEVKS